MQQFITELKLRNETMFWFSALCFSLAILFIILTKLSTTQVAGVNAWYKPFKFAASIAIYCATMAWFSIYLKQTAFNVRYFNITVISLFVFELVYIAVQAYRGQLSHFNLSTPFYSFLYTCMAVAASLIAIYTAYVAILFFSYSFPQLPIYYLWAIRIALVLFVIFSFEGFVMGSRLSHTIGGPDGGSGLPILNWSTRFGDARIAHFIGMHALQVLPLAAYYILKDTKAVVALSLLYAMLAFWVLIQALNAKPLIKV